MKTITVTVTKKTILLCISFLFFLIGNVSAKDLFISEYVEGSSNNKAIEIYNSTGADVDLAANGYKIEMYFNGNTTVGLTIPLVGIVSNNNAFVLAHALAILPINANQTSNASWFNGDDAIVLKKGATVIDVIGQIGFDPGTEWGVGLLSTADNTLRRKNNFCQGDTSRFNVFNPTTEWDGFTTNDFSNLGNHNSCSTISALNVSVTSLDFSTTVGVPSVVQSYTLQGNFLTADVTVISSANFEVSINAAGPFSNILTIPQADAVIGKLMYVRYVPLVVGSHLGNISHTSDSISAIISLQGTSDVTNSTPIYVIQGVGAASTYDGLTVTTEGVVVGDFQETNQLKGFYIQDTIGDANSSSSDGIFVYNTTFPVKTGDYIRLTGEVDEFNTLTEIKNVTSLTTLLTGKTIPSTIIKLPISQSADLEKYEGMLVNFTDTLTVTENYNLGRFGELTLSSQGRIINPTNFIDPNDNPSSGTNSNGTSNVAAIINQQTNNLNRSILLDDGSALQNPATVPYIDSINNTLRAGTTVSNLVGIVDFAFNYYRIQPTITPSFNYALRPTAPTVGNANIKVASFNVLNYFNGDGLGGGFPTERGATTMSEFTRQRTKIIEALKQMNADVVGLMEMENDGDDPYSAIADLVNGLNTAIGAVTYDYILDPKASNGNLGTDAIKQAIIYKISTLNPYGAAVADTNSAYSVNGYARHPLAQTFTVVENGEKFSIIVNHFKSKSCGNAAGVDLDQNDGQACYNDSRKKQAAQLLNFLAQVKTKSADNDVILLGDFNAYEEEDPIDILRAGGLTNLITNNYSFVFNGNAGSLDHALVTPELTAKVTGAEKWHLNADEPRIKNYNQEFNPAYVYSADAFRSSDHDPVIVGLNLQPNTFKLQVLHASDLEGSVDAILRAPNFAAIIDKLEDEYPLNTIKLLAGDNWIPGPFFNAAADRTVLDPVLRNVYNNFFGAGTSNNLRASEGRIDLSIMNLIGFDASAMGNHEFDGGTAKVAEILGSEISGTQVRWMGAQFPYLSANLDFSQDVALAPLFTNQLLNNKEYISRPDTLKATSPKYKIAPATIKICNGEKIGVIGCTTQILESITSAGGVKVKGVKNNNMPELANYIQPIIDQLKGMGVNKIILVSHLQQLALERSLVGLLNDVDIIIAGGSSSILADDNDVLWSGDTRVDTYPLLTQNKNGEPALIVSTDQEYKYVGRLVVAFDPTGVIIPSSIDTTKNGPIATMDENVEALWGNLTNAFATGTKGEQVQYLTTAVKNIVTAQDGNIYGKTNVFLEGKRTEVRTEETNLGNLSADANLTYAQSLYDSTVIVSIKNGGGIRASIGEIKETSPGIYEELPPQANPLSGKQTGEVSELDIINSLRFNNGLTLLTLNPSQLLQVINYGVAAVAPGATPGQFSQVGGLSFSYDASLPVGGRVKNLVIIDKNNKVVDLVAKDGIIEGNPNRKIRIVTLNFLANGGDGYPFPIFITADSAFANRVDLVIPGTTRSGTALFADNGSEQDAFAEYLLANYNLTPYNKKDTPMKDDKRIQNLALRADSVLIAPLVNITAPVNNDLVAVGNLVSIKANASDTDGHIIKVEFFVNGSKIGEDTSAPYQYDWMGIEGVASITIVATDNTGLQTTSLPIIITIKNICNTLNVNAGADQTVQLGYTPNACTTLSSMVTGGTPPYDYSWSNGKNTPLNTVCPKINTVYTVTITDTKGCKATDNVSVCVEDVSCAKTNILLCGTFMNNGKIITKYTFCVPENIATYLVSNLSNNYVSWKVGACNSKVCTPNNIIPTNSDNNIVMNNATTKVCWTYSYRGKLITQQDLEMPQYVASYMTSKFKVAGSAWKMGVCNVNKGNADSAIESTNLDENEKLANNESAISVYPNPTSNIALINLELLNIANENAQIIITDVLGKLLLKQPVFIDSNLMNKSIYFDYELPQGIYIVNVITSKMVFTERLIVK